MFLFPGIKNWKWKLLNNTILATWHCTKVTHYSHILLVLSWYVLSTIITTFYLSNRWIGWLIWTRQSENLVFFFELEYFTAYVYNFSILIVPALITNGTHHKWRWSARSLDSCLTEVSLLRLDKYWRIFALSLLTFWWSSWRGE